MTWPKELVVFIYAVLFTGSIAAMLWWQKRQRTLRKPFSDDIRLMRSAGETQLKQVLRFEEAAVVWLVLAAILPAAAGLLLLMAAAQLPAVLQWAGVMVAAVVFLGLFLVAARWFAGKTREMNNRYLGYFGERVVGEHLEPLKRQGWRIFHDVPAVADGDPSNLDHVAVGPQGVFAIETKTRRKGGVRPGFADHKVYFDGRSLVWPWGEDNHGLDQAERNAAWLAGALLAELGEQVPVAPLLTLPGWVVENKPSRDSRLCRVVNPHILPALLPGGPGILDTRQIAAIAAKLEARCRDVEY